MRLFSTPVAAIAFGCLLLGGAPASASSKLIPVTDGEVSYETCGSGPKAVVLLHDGILDGSGFDAAWPLLCAKARVVRYDRRGYGASPAATAPYDAVCLLYTSPSPRDS